MSYKIFLNKDSTKKIFVLTRSEKIKLTKALDLMESIGQMGDLLFKDLNVWKYRVGNLRIIYKKKGSEFYILSIVKGIDPTIV